MIITAAVSGKWIMGIFCCGKLSTTLAGKDAVAPTGPYANNLHLTPDR